MLTRRLEVMEGFGMECLAVIDIEFHTLLIAIAKGMLLLGLGVPWRAC